MQTAQKMTAQGVRDLNHTGPKEKPTPIDAGTTTAQPSPPVAAAPASTDK
ncbi:MAG TPA: hypothetical protein VNN25_18970 [Thermoanaerobaculia bacterium]|nr:hypothetical protein [Thermoanaerobaculia bacterium]